MKLLIVSRRLLWCVLIALVGLRAATVPDVEWTPVRTGPEPAGAHLQFDFRDVPSYVPFMAAPLSEATATFDVQYPSSTPPAARAAFQRAVDIWATQIASSVPIRILVAIDLSRGTSTSVGDWFVNFPGAPIPDTAYPAALANKLAGVDLSPGSGSFQADMSVTLRTEGMYLGLDGRPPPGQFDFVTVVLHEIGHGLGVFGSARVASGSDSGTLGVFSEPGAPLAIYDRFIRTGGGQYLADQSIFRFRTFGVLEALTSGDLFFATPPFTGAITAPAEIHAPNPFDQLLSFNHLDEHAFPPGSPDSLMTPVLAQMEAIHDPGPLTRAMLQDMGWTVADGGPAPPTPQPPPPGPDVPGKPTNVQAAVNGALLLISWNVSSSGPAPTGHRLEFSAGGCSSPRRSGAPCRVWLCPFPRALKEHSRWWSGRSSAQRPALHRIPRFLRSGAVPVRALGPRPPQRTSRF
jgi:hypothetical protein